VIEMIKRFVPIIRNIWFLFFIKTKPLLLKALGAKVGSKCKIYTALKNFDIQFLKFLTIGNNVVIARNVIILTHDGSIYNMKKFKIEKKEFDDIIIDEGAFIGAGSIILPGVKIGKNTIIGAGSVVTKSIPGNSVAVGNPCRIIKKLEIK
jgi:acetyltransferase-like isoleucine patch superfamily enzyme